MQFVQFGMLGALSALAIPIIIHLMFRRQARTVELGTLQFLKVVLRENSRKRRLKRYILLALRMACVALIALLFARPFLLAEEPSTGERLVVVLIDRSASMGLTGGPRPIDRASAELHSILAKAGEGTKLEIAVFDRAVAPVAKASEAGKATKEPTAAGTDYDQAMAWARDICIRSSAKSKELHILTDLQRSGLGRGDTARIPAEVDVHLVGLGRPFPKNVAVTGLAASPASPRPRDSVIVTAIVRNTSPLPVEKVPVRLHLESQGASPIDQDRTIDIDGEASATVEFKLSEMEEGLWRGYVEAKFGDDLPFDDRRYLALAVAPAARIMLVDGDPGRSALEAETYFLDAALRLAPKGETYAKAPFDPRTVDLFDLRTGLPDLSKMSAVVLANVADLPAADAKALAGFVERGGGLIVFTGDRVTAGSSASLIEAGLGIGMVVGTESSPERPWRLDRWEQSHPLLKPFAEAEHGDIRRPAFTSITKITPDTSVRVLASFRGGDPALLERSIGRGKVVWFASSCDRGWGDWPRGRMFLPMVHQMVAYASGLAEGGPVRPELASAGLIPGLIEVDGIVRVVNSDPYESETALCTPREFADRYGFRLPEAGSVASKSLLNRKSADDRLRSDEIWPWIALTLVGILMFEQFLANRTAA
jgi:Aerotolerance regulator N-terminal